MKEFKNKVALITGADNGFGQEFAKEACRRGMSNPNRVRSLIGAFASSNPAAFHAEDGSGYQFMIRQIRAIHPRGSFGAHGGRQTENRD